MNKQIFAYRESKRLPGSVTLHRDGDDNVTVTVCAPATQLDGGYLEVGGVATLTLPASEVEQLINALWDVGPH